MTDSGRFLGKTNGFNILGDCLSEDITMEQARACIVAHCIMFGIKPDTAAWDEVIDFAFDNYNVWFDTYNEMEEYVSEYF